MSTKKSFKPPKKPGHGEPFASPDDLRRKLAIERVKSGLPSAEDAEFLRSEERRARQKSEAAKLQMATENTSVAGLYGLFQEPDRSDSSAQATAEMLCGPLGQLAWRGARDVTRTRKSGFERTAKHPNWLAALQEIEARCAGRRQPSDRQLAKDIARKCDAASAETVRDWLKRLRAEQKKTKAKGPF